MNETVRALIAPVDALPDPMRQRLVAAAVTAPAIQEPGATDPRLPKTAADEGAGRPAGRVRAGVSVLNAVVPMDPLAAPSRPAPCLAPGDGLRLIPLSGFHWGGALRGRNLPPAPRVRGDHVLILPSAGLLQIEFPGNRQSLRAGQLAFIPAGTAFALPPGQDLQGRALLIAPHHGRELPIPLPASFRSGALAPADAPLVEPAMLALGAMQPQGSASAAAAASQVALIAVALSRLKAHCCDSTRHHPLGEARPLTERFLALAGAELAQNQTIAEMARKLGHSLAHLDRACRQSRGRSALDLLYDLRLERAAMALRDSTRPIAEIAQELGYAGPGHFIRSFAAATGRSPEGYRDYMRAAARAPCPDA